MSRLLGIPHLRGSACHMAIILPYVNAEIGEALYRNTYETLIRSGVRKKNISLFRVPGALEIPFLAQKLLRKRRFHALIALGVIIRGETPHFDLVAHETYHALMQIQLAYATPIIFGILTVNTKKQAVARISRGKDFALSAIHMAQ